MVIGVVVGVLVGQGGNGDSANDETAAAGPPLPHPGQLSGLQETEGPWQPELANLESRIAALQFPPLGNEAYHIHALLTVFVNGKAVPVPAQIGLNSEQRVASPLHTHDGTGVIHMEAAFEFPFRLPDIFAVWGVVFSKDQLGAFKNSGERTVQVYVNGKKLADPEEYFLKTHDNVVVAYGLPGSFDTEPPADALKDQP